MKRFFISISQCIIQSIAIIFLFIPNMYIMDIYVPMSGFYGAWQKALSFQLSFQGITSYSDIKMPETFTWLFIVLMFLSLGFTVISSISYYTNQKHFLWAQYKSWFITSAIILILFIGITTILCLPPKTSYTSGHSEVSVGILFYFETLLFVLNLALDAFKRFAPINETKTA